MQLAAPWTLDLWDVLADPAPRDGGPTTAPVGLPKVYAGPVLLAPAGGHALTTRGPGEAS